jgi:hypothetical protein
VLDNDSPHLSTRDDPRVGRWAAASKVALAYAPTNASWRNRIEAQFTALRYLAVDDTDHASPTQQASMIRRCIAWPNRPAHDGRRGHVNRGKRCLTRHWSAWTGPRARSRRENEAHRVRAARCHPRQMRWARPKLITPWLESPGVGRL